MALLVAASPAPKRAPFILRGLIPRDDLAEGLPPPLVLGPLEVRVAATKKEVQRAQKLRYRVFFEEGAAIPSPVARATKRDLCCFDRVCDHLIVIDRSASESDGSSKTVGVYRLLRQEVAERNFGFYSSREFDVDKLVARQPSVKLLEVGRACVAQSHRGTRVLELLWRGLSAYARLHGMDAMIGCASMPGTDVEVHATTIRALVKRGDPEWWVQPRPKRTAGPWAKEGPTISEHALMHALPPLVKGYWRLGATFSPTPVVDQTFGTTDLFVALLLRTAAERYQHHFAAKTLQVQVASGCRGSWSLCARG